MSLPPREQKVLDILTMLSPYRPEWFDSQEARAWCKITNKKSMQQVLQRLTEEGHLEQKKLPRLNVPHGEGIHRWRLTK
jgi:hypothetical protein